MVYHTIVITLNLDADHNVSSSECFHNCHWSTCAGVFFLLFLSQTYHHRILCILSWLHTYLKSFSLQKYIKQLFVICSCLRISIFLSLQLVVRLCNQVVCKPP